ncbi:hypothetical protein PR048_019177 [Dryococelus australis]|uniref:Uncharacterized protein n=1 Tax=Dryococelus australis TaxID=614101 RepID=A0ABQ9H2R9_9NEOP|nr:hypothetical protein PR048_019177 [Dryococelus australis]
MKGRLLRGRIQVPETLRGGGWVKSAGRRMFWPRCSLEVLARVSAVAGGAAATVEAVSQRNYGRGVRSCLTHFDRLSSRVDLRSARFIVNCLYTEHRLVRNDDGALDGRVDVDLVAPALVGLAQWDRHAGPRSRSEGAIRATLTRTPSASSLLRARRAVFPSYRCTIAAPSRTAPVADKSSLSCETASTARRSPTHRTTVEPAVLDQTQGSFPEPREARERVRIHRRNGHAISSLIGYPLPTQRPPPPAEDCSGNIQIFKKVVALPIRIHAEDEDILHESRNGSLFPNTVRCIMAGPSGCGKTCVLLSLLEEETGLRFENVYLYSRSLQQPKYRRLARVLQAVEGTGYFPCGDNEAIVPPSEALRNSIFVFNGIACEKQTCIQEYFSMGRHANVECVRTSARPIREYPNNCFATTQTCWCCFAWTIRIYVMFTMIMDQQVISSIPPTTSMGTVSADDYDATVNAKDGMSAVCTVHLQDIRVRSKNFKINGHKL